MAVLDFNSLELPDKLTIEIELHHLERGQNGVCNIDTDEIEYLHVVVMIAFGSFHLAL